MNSSTYENLVREVTMLRDIAFTLELRGLSTESIMDEIAEINEQCINYLVEKRKIDDLTMELGNLDIGPGA